MAKKRLVIANWKLYIESPEEAKKFASTLRRRAKTFVGTDAWIAPSYPLIPAVAAALKGSIFKIGAQTVSSFGTGAHTGFVSAATVKNAGASFVIVGHSERRMPQIGGVQAAGETNETVAAIFAAAASAGLTALLCVGEREREGDYFGFIEEQLRSALAGQAAFANKLVVAYEPVWAIGKSAEDAMKPAEVQETVIYIKKILADVLGREKALRVPILYGGSVEPENAAQLIGEGGVNGFLVGHASANAESFIEILKCLK